MKYLFLNDTTKKMGIHSASVDAGKHYLEPAEYVEVNIPDGTIPYIKVWDNMVLLTYVDEACITQ